MKIKILKNNLLLYNINIFVLRLPSTTQNIKINREIKPTFPGIMLCGRAVEKHKIHDKKNIDLSGETNVKS